MYRLLIADGGDGMLDGVPALLPWQSYGFETVVRADSYTAAVDLALDIRPHAALVAMRLGGRPGTDLIVLLRSAGLDTAFCVVSDSDEPALILQAMRAGARDFLPAPPDAGQLRAFLERILPGCTCGMPNETAATAPGIDPILGVEPARLSPLVNKILLMARSGLNDPPVCLTAIAEQLHMNSKYLGRVFLRETGMKLSQYVTACRMEQARRLIVGTQEKISVIAKTVGYSQLNRFHVHFRNHFGISPGALRASAARPGDAATEDNRP